MTPFATPMPPADVVTPGLLGFIVVAGIGVVLFFLVRSMNKHLRRIRTDDDRAADEQSGDKRDHEPEDRGPSSP